VQETDYAIFELFRHNPHAEFSTTEIVERITPGYDAIHQDLYSNDLDHQNAAKKRKAELHRKTLYYLNKLVRKGALTIKSVGKNKERIFAALQDPHEISPAYRMHAQLPLPGITPALGIEGYEEKGIVARYEPTTWVERVNSILLESTYFKQLKDLISTANNTLTCVNDAIALNDFEQVIQKNNPQTVLAALKALSKQAESHARHVTLIIDVTNIEKQDSVLQVIRGVIENDLHNLTFIYDMQVKEFQDHKDFFKNIVKTYNSAGKSLFIKNQTVHQAPYLIGKAGPYTFDERDWKLYRGEYQGRMPGLVCGTATFLIDVGKLVTETKAHHAAAIIELIGKLAKSLLLTNAEQRERSEHFLGGLIQENPAHAQNYFMFSRNYVRFWNYGWKTPDYDQEFVTKYLGESKKAADEYCINEETIYKSCGMPTRFRIAYSCTDSGSAKKLFLPANYRRITVNSPTDFFNNDDINNIISTKEEIFKYFDGGDRITFDRPVPKKPEDVVNEISYILNTFRLPFFRYHFTNQSEMPLTRYL
jgi:hypothetical protein